MLIQFSLANFRSFREEQTFSMVAAPRIGKKENKFKPPINEDFPYLLRTAVIYGPNASGKSNLLKGLHALIDIAKREPSNKNDYIPVQPFAFDPDLAGEASKFEIHFIANELRYEFILHANKDYIVKEKLTAFPNGDEEVLYERTFIKKTESYDYFFGIQEDALILNFWENITPKDVLFLSQIISNNKKPESKLLSAFEWLTKGLTCHLDGANQLLNATIKLLKSDHNNADKVREFYAQNLTDFLRDFDVPISSIEYEEKNNIDEFSKESKYKQTKDIYFKHDTKLGKYRINFEDQSAGTKSLVSFYAPWMRTQEVRNGRIAGSTLIVDELDSSLHPLIVESLVKKHINNSDSTSQLIFTTHDTHLMNAKILRRDQIWVTDRDAYGATILTCLHEYEGREGEDIEKRYYEGRYKGLPQRRS